MDEGQKFPLSLSSLFSHMLSKMPIQEQQKHLHTEDYILKIRHYSFGNTLTDHVEEAPTLRNQCILTVKTGIEEIRLVFRLKVSKELGHHIIYLWYIRLYTS